jgi:hypothetical protein
LKGRNLLRHWTKKNSAVAVNNVENVVPAVIGVNAEMVMIL